MSRLANPSEDVAYFDDVKVTKETQLSILCVLDSGTEVWIPKSQIHDDSEVIRLGDEGRLAIPTWLAEDRELT